MQIESGISNEAGFPEIKDRKKNRRKIWALSHESSKKLWVFLKLEARKLEATGDSDTSISSLGTFPPSQKNVCCYWESTLHH